MEKKLNFGLKLSLEQLAVQSVANHIWNNADILNSIEIYLNSRLYKRDSFKVWGDIVENKVKKKILELALPKSLTKQILNLVKPMGNNTLKWIRFIEKILNTRDFFDVSVLAQICRSDKGSISDLRTVYRLVRLQTLDVFERYRLASIFCMVDYIPVLWAELPECAKTISLYEQDSMEMECLDLGIYWAFIMKGMDYELYKIIGSCVNQFGFERTVMMGNKAAAKYFFHKLSEEERKIHLFRSVRDVIYGLGINDDDYTFPMEKHFEVLRFLLTEMDLEQQLQLLLKYPNMVLKCFLEWPWQDLFLEIADIVWIFLSECKYTSLMHSINSYVTYSNHYVPNFFREFFPRSPIKFRKCLLYHSTLVFFPMFLAAEDTESVEIVFRNIGAEGRMKLVSSRKFFKFFDILLAKDKWDWIELCFREARLSKTDGERFKTIYSTLPPEPEYKFLLCPQQKMHQRKFLQILENFCPSSLNKES